MNMWGVAITIAEPRNTHRHNKMPRIDTISQPAPKPSPLLFCPLLFLWLHSHPNPISQFTLSNSLSPIQPFIFPRYLPLHLNVCTHIHCVSLLSSRHPKPQSCSAFTFTSASTSTSIPHKAMHKTTSSGNGIHSRVQMYARVLSFIIGTNAISSALNSKQIQCTPRAFTSCNSSPEI